MRAETPQARGVHGVSMRRSVGYVPEGGRQSWVDAMNDVVIALMIEKKGAVENLLEGLSVEGVDVAQSGDTDFRSALACRDRDGASQCNGPIAA